jgi:predicted enzyme related to lactoylglutathione lyase
MQYLPGKFVWFEHVSSDVAQARTFYQELFGWSVQPMPMGEQTYHRIVNGEQGIGGFRTAEPGMQSHWASYLSVPDVDKSFAAAKAAGASALLAPTDFGPVGRGCAVADPSGAAVGLWKGAQGDPADAAPPVGGWCWNELFSKDVKAAVAFYEKAFGFTHEEKDMGPQGPYYLLKDAGGTMRAGALQQPPGMDIPSNWLPYVRVADCNASVATAVRLGASTTMAPTDVPGVGRFAVVIDPAGAAIGLLQGA